MLNIVSFGAHILTLFVSTLAGLNFLWAPKHPKNVEWSPSDDEFFCQKALIDLICL